MSELKCTLVQTKLAWQDIEANVKNIDRMLKSHHESTDLIILPEMFTTGFTMSPKGISQSMDGKVINWMTNWAQKKKSVLMGSLIVEEDGKFYNRLVFVDSGGVFAHYDKKHLFTLAGEDKSYQQGADRVLVEIKGWKIMPMICYDLRFPVWSRNEKVEPYDLLIYVANWPKPRISHWDVLLRARAIENQAFCIGVNRIGSDGNQLDYVGHSSVFDFSGENLISLEESECLPTVTLKRESLLEYRGKLAFLEDSDEFQFRD